MAKGIKAKDQQKFQAYQLWQTSHISLEKIGEKFGVCRQTVRNWIDDVRVQIDEPAIIAAAKQDMIELVPEATRYYSRAVRRKTIDMVGLQSATNILKTNDLLRDKVQIDHSFPDSDGELLNEFNDIITKRLGKVSTNGTKATG